MRRRRGGEEAALPPARVSELNARLRVEELLEEFRRVEEGDSWAAAAECGYIYTY